MKTWRGWALIDCDGEIVGQKDNPLISKDRGSLLAHAIKGNGEKVVPVEVWRIEKRCGCGIIDDVGVTCKRHTPKNLRPVKHNVKEK